MAISNAESRRRYYQKNKKKCLVSSKKWYQKNKKQMLKAFKVWRGELREQVLKVYGGGDFPKCACCGEDIVEFLTIDHVDGKGNDHRREIGRNIMTGSTGLYSWLRKNNFPEGFRVLCFNCNCAIAIHGKCPHKEN